MKKVTTQVIKFETPQRVLLWGLQLGSSQPRRVYVFIHGLGGGIFSRIDLISQLPDKNSAVLTFNNRGSGLVNGIKKRQGKKYQYANLGGLAHEVFTDCVDDISGAVNYALALGAKEIFLVGHSTGCQKSIYYLAKKANSPVKGAILLAPVSDYSAMKQEIDWLSYRKILREANKLVRMGREHSLLPAGLWKTPIDAQRFLSLYTPDSQEEIFSYATERQPVLLKKVKQPLLVLLASADEYHDRPAAEIAAWFKKSLAKQMADTMVIQGVGHDFSSAEQKICRLIRDWSNRLRPKKS